MTPRQFALTLQGYRERQRQSHNETAYHTVMLMRAWGSKIEYNDIIIKKETEAPTKKDAMRELEAAYRKAEKMKNGT
jgi:hypothetical protein